jgi:hypothetical protein
LGRIGGPDAAHTLHKALSQEEDPEVLEEIQAALRDVQA